MQSFPAQRSFKKRMNASLCSDASLFEYFSENALETENYTTLPEGVKLDELNLEQLYGLLSARLNKQH